MGKKMEAVEVLLVISVKQATTADIISAITSGEKSFRIKNWSPNHSDKPDSWKEKASKLFHVHENRYFTFSHNFKPNTT